MRRRYGFKPKAKVIPRYRINDYIRANRVVVIDENGQNLGEMTPQEGTQIARERMLDLIEVSPNAEPPVCRIMDYGKFQYQQAKQQQASQAKQKKIDTKEVRLGLRTGEHDLNFKHDQTEKFLSKGDKVKIEIILKGREKAHQDLARNILQDFVAKVTIPIRVEEPIKRFPGGFNILIVPE